MGKKRRLKSAKAKFAAKHSSHPRMVLLRAQARAEEIEAEAPPLTPVVEATAVLTAEETITTPVASTVEETEAPAVAVKKTKPTKKKRTARKTTSKRTKKKISLNI